jgi:hypothetical protein
MIELYKKGGVMAQTVVDSLSRLSLSQLLAEKPSWSLKERLRSD